ncbi:hypothetical protein VP01_1771g6, partial [Puccinia sorghi]
MAVKAQLCNWMFIVSWEGGFPIKVIIKFHLFIAGKSKQEKKNTWVSIANEANILVDYGLTYFKDFQTRVAMACNNTFSNTPPLILKSISSQTPTIEWLVTIPRTPNFLKKDKYHLQSQSDYTTWHQTTADTEKSE